MSYKIKTISKRKEITLFTGSVSKIIHVHTSYLIPNFCLFARLLHMLVKIHCQLQTEAKWYSQNNILVSEIKRLKIRQ